MSVLREETKCKTYHLSLSPPRSRRLEDTGSGTRPANINVRPSLLDHTLFPFPPPAFYLFFALKINPLTAHMAEMGFPIHWCERALAETGDDIEAALNWILSNGELLSVEDSLRESIQAQSQAAAEVSAAEAARTEAAAAAVAADAEVAAAVAEAGAASGGGGEEGEGGEGAAAGGGGRGQQEGGDVAGQERGQVRMRRGEKPGATDMGPRLTALRCCYACYRRKSCCRLGTCCTGCVGSSNFLLLVRCTLYQKSSPCVCVLSSSCARFLSLARNVESKNRASSAAQ